MKKKLSTIYIAAAAISLLCACQSANEPAAAANAPSVITAASTFAVETETTENQTVPGTPIETTTISETATTAVPAEELIDSNMPKPFAEDSDDNVSYYQPGNRVLDNIPAELMRIVDSDRLIEWLESYDIFDNPPQGLTEYTNIYSFIKHFDLSDEDVTEAMSNYLSSDDPQIKITEDELDLILHGSEADIVSYFASEYSIVVGDKIYCPSWIYTHTPAAYKQAEITPDDLREKADVYADIDFANEARAALNEKINSYIGD